jgi:hypothetical protein
MASWGEVCRECVNTVVQVPIEILLAAVIATLLGSLVLVSSHISPLIKPDRGTVIIPIAKH